MSSSRRTIRVIALLLSLALLVSSCGDDEQDDQATESPSSSESTDGGATAPEFERKKIGIVYLTKANEYSVRAAEAYKAAFDFLGWEFVEIDAQADPAAAETAMQTLIAQDVDAILDASWEPQPIAAGLRDAEAAGIPVIVVFGAVTPDPGFAGQLVTADADLAAPLVERFFEEIPEGAKVAKINSTQFGWGQTRDTVFEAALAARPDVEVVAEHQIDYFNLEADTISATQDILTANPDLDAIWNDVSVTVPAIIQVLKSAGLCDGDGGFTLVSFIGDLPNNQAIRDECVTALADPPIIAQSWVVADVLASHLLGGEPLPEAFPDYDGFDYKTITLIDSDTVPSDESQYFELSDAGVGVDYAEFFTERWATAFGG